MVLKQPLSTVLSFPHPPTDRVKSPRQPLLNVTVCPLEHFLVVSPDVLPLCHDFCPLSVSSSWSISVGGCNMLHVFIQIPGVLQVFNRPTASSCYRRLHWREHHLPPSLPLSHLYARLMQIKSKLLCSLLNSAYSLRYLKTFQSLRERLFIFSITPVNEVRGKLILGWQKKKKKEWPRYNGQSCVCACVCVCVLK